MNETTQSDTQPVGMTMIPLSQIKTGANPRRYFSPAKHDELVASLRLRGMLQPILVRPADERGTFAIVAGERRFRAALEAFGPEGEVPVTIREMSDQEALEASIDENDIREDASETEQADAAVRVLAACQNDRAEAAKRLGWSTAKLDRRLALAGLSDAVKAALDERRIKVGHAELLAAVPADKQDRALETILSAGIDVAKTRELLMRMTQSLAAAIFDKTECASCGYNSARQCALFETHVDDGHCTNGACFQLKTETAEKARAEAAAAAAPPPAQVEVEADGEGKPGKVQNDLPAADKSGGSLKPAAPAKAAAPAPAPSKPKVTTEGLAAKLADTREQAWRNAVAAAFADSADHLRICLIAEQAVRSGQPISFATVAGYADEFEVDLRNTWRVDGEFLGHLNKDELKFVAQECGLVEHMGEKRFANVLGGATHEIIAAMLHATGFDWAGRLPSCMTLDGQYGAPIAANTASEED